MIPPANNNNNNNRVATSLKTNTNNGNVQMRDRTSTLLVAPVKTNLVVQIRPNTAGTEQIVGNNIPVERNIEYFK